MAWEPDSEEIRLRKQNEAIRRVEENTFFINSGIGLGDTSSNVGTVNGLSGFNFGMIGDAITNTINDWSTALGEIDLVGAFMKVFPAPIDEPTVDCATINILRGGGKNNTAVVGQRVTFKPQAGKTICLVNNDKANNSTAGNMMIDANVTINENQLVTLRYQNDVVYADSSNTEIIGGWVLESSSAGGSGSSASTYHKEPVFVASPTGANAILASEVEDGDVIDGELISTGDRILLKSQTTASENGIYVVKASGAPDRATDFNSSSNVLDTTIIGVREGTTNKDTYWQVTSNDVIDVGTDDIVIIGFSGVGDDLGSHIATQALKMQDFTIFLDTALDQSIIASALANNYIVPTGGAHDFYVNGLIIPKFGITETDVNSNVPVNIFGVDTNPFLEFNRDYDVASPTDLDVLGVISWKGDNDTSAEKVFATIGVSATDVSTGSEDAKITISPMASGGQGNNVFSLVGDDMEWKTSLSSLLIPKFTIYRDDLTPADGEELGRIVFDGTESIDVTPVRGTFGEIRLIGTDAKDTAEESEMRFRVRGLGAMTTAYSIQGAQGFPAGAPLHQFEGNIEVKNINGGSNMGLTTTHSIDPNNNFDMNLGSGASAVADIDTNVENIVFTVNVGERMRIASSGSLPTTETITSWTSYNNPSNLELYNDGQGTVAPDDILGTIKFFGDTSGVGAETRYEYGSIRVLADDSTEPSPEGEMRFNILDNNTLITYLRLEPTKALPVGGTFGAVVSEVPLITQSIYPNTASDIGHSSSTWQESYINDMFCDKLIFDETEAPDRTQTSIGADANRMWFNRQSGDEFEFTVNDGAQALRTHEFPSNHSIIWSTSDISSKFDLFLNSNLEARFLTNEAPEFYFSANFDGANNTRMKILGTGFTTLNAHEVLFDSSTQIANDIVGQIHWIGEDDVGGGADFDIAKIIARNQVPTNATRSGSLSFELSSLGTENTTYMIMDGFNSDIEFYKPIDMQTNYIEIGEQSAPTQITNSSLIYSKDVSTVTHLFTRDSDGTEHDLSVGAGGSHNLLSATHADTLTASVVRGDVIIGNSTPAWARLAKGTANQVLSMNGAGTDVVWATASGGEVFTWTANHDASDFDLLQIDNITSGANNVHDWTISRDAILGTDVEIGSLLWRSFDGVSVLSDYVSLIGTVESSSSGSEDGSLKIQVATAGNHNLSYMRFNDGSIALINVDQDMNFGANDLLSTGNITNALDSTYDIGTSGVRYQDAYFDNTHTGNIQDNGQSITLVASGIITSTGVGDSISFLMNGATDFQFIENQFTVANTSIIAMTGGNITGTGDILPTSNNTKDLGSDALEFADLWIDGTAHIDILDIDVSSTFTGTATFNDSVVLGGSSADNITFNGDVVLSITPNTTDTYSIGSATLRWSELFANDDVDITEGFATGFKPTPSTNDAQIFCVPKVTTNKTQLRVGFQTGGSIVIAEEA